MLFKRASAAYGETPEPETPFQKAGQIWDERIGAARAQAANWRFMAFGCLALATAASAGLIWRSLQSTVTPYVVEVDELGAVQAIGPATLRYDPTDAQIAHHLARFLENVRGLSGEPDGVVALAPVAARIDDFRAFLREFRRRRRLCRAQTVGNYPPTDRRPRLPRKPRGENRPHDPPT